MSRYPPEEWRERLALLQTWGQQDEADHLLTMLNRVQRAFDFPDYAMPEPALTGLPELVTLDATPLSHLFDSDGGVGDPMLRVA